MSLIKSHHQWSGLHLPRLSYKYQQTDLDVFITGYLGYGVSASVWEGKIQIPAMPPSAETTITTEKIIVCKMFTNIEQFHREHEVWTELTARRSSLGRCFDSLHLSYLQHFNPTSSTSSSSSSLQSSLPTLFLEPLGYRPHRLHLTRPIVKSMFACIRELRELRIVHRDITPHHFLSLDSDPATCTATSRFFLIDFGFAVFLPTNKWEDADEVPLDGTWQFAPSSVLHHLFDKGHVLYEPRLCHDLESLVKVLIALTFEPVMDKLRSLGHNVREIIQFWDDTETWLARYDGWTNAIKQARLDKYRTTRNIVVELIPASQLSAAEDLSESETESIWSISAENSNLRM